MSDHPTAAPAGEASVEMLARQEFERQNPHGRWDDLPVGLQVLWRGYVVDMNRGALPGREHVTFTAHREGEDE